MAGPVPQPPVAPPPVANPPRLRPGARIKLSTTTKDGIVDREAVVTHVKADSEIVAAVAFLTGNPKLDGLPMHVSGVTHDEDAKPAGTWHW
jgi:hypothetical protein